MKSPPRFLIVDDEPAFARLVQDIAEGCGYATCGAADGKAAQGIAARFDPDVVMVDMIMPEADGIEFIRWLAASGFRSRLILVTGYDQRYLEMAEIIARSAGLPDVNLLMKPMRAAGLEALLNRKREA